MEYKDAKEECVEVSSEQREVDNQSTGESHDLRHHGVEQKLGHSKASKQKTYHNNIVMDVCMEIHVSQRSISTQKLIFLGTCTNLIVPFNPG